MYKKSGLAVMLAVLLSGMVLMTGCGSSQESKPKDIVTEEATDKAAEEVKEEEESAEAEATENEEEAPEKESKSTDSGNITIEEQVLVDQDGLKITALGYDVDSIWGDGIKVLIENDTDKDLSITCDALIVNDYMIGDLFYTDIAAGKKANDTIRLYTSELKEAGIDTVGKIEIYFRAFDSDTYEDYLKTDCVTIETSAYDNMDTTVDDAGTELYNEDGIRIVGKTVDENSFWGTAILLYIENNSGRNVAITVEDLSVNGFMLSPSFYADVYDGKKAIEDITLFSSDLEENGITSIDQVELKFHIFDPETFDYSIDSDPITFSTK